MIGNDLFGQINNAVLDLQSAQLQSYPRPLKTLGRLLLHPDLAAANKALTEGLNLDHFLESAKTQGGMVGSAQLVWPDSHEQMLGLTLQLIERFAENPDSMADFGHMYCYSGNSVMSGGAGRYKPNYHSLCARLQSVCPEPWQCTPSAGCTADQQDFHRAWA
ncbi:hypothetical protein [Azospirillum sp. A26]|uniref:hypothetical protein n=1 Tax=Azospirillum sp. A26 TaxID=3160607 RepID=UPI003671CC6B